MGVRDWFKALSSSVDRRVGNPDAVWSDTQIGNTIPAPDADSLSEQERVSVVVGGLNFLDAIKAHQAWKARLTEYVASRGGKKRIEANSVCRDDQCELGKWINGKGGHAYGDRLLFCQLKMTHAQFHLAAGNVVSLCNDGRVEQAGESLRSGEYPQASIRVQGLLSSLFLEIEDNAKAK